MSWGDKGDREASLKFIFQTGEPPHTKDARIRLFSKNLLET